MTDSSAEASALGSGPRGRRFKSALSDSVCLAIAGALQTAKRDKIWKSSVFYRVRTAPSFFCINQKNSVDLMIAVNGIPVFAFELKNQFTGQSLDNAKKQWIYDRDPREQCFRFNSRILAFFCIDQMEACMATKLAGKDTYFLPFNQGSNGPGRDGGAGNPVIPDDYQTSYIW